MVEAFSSLLVYGAPMALLVGLYARARARESDRARRARDVSFEQGLAEPPSLHPVIDPSRCIGCAACVRACPENEVLGLIDAKAELINPSHCIGHGACQSACPTQAIELVFGTERRGIDIPRVGPNFETNVPGVFIAGELGGMGLIRNAVEQGRQAIEAIYAAGGQGFGPLASNDASPLDVVIVGAGPAGFSASLAAMERGLRFVTLEQDTLGGTVAHYPRGKIVMTAPVVLPIVGRVRFKSTTKEALLSFWRDVEQRTGVRIRYGERVEGIERSATGFTVRTLQSSYDARAVLLAIGRRGTPRKLGVPGEDCERLVYRLIDPEQYQGKRMVVVGGGDSALEAAVALSACDGTQVTLVYRGDGFGRAKLPNRQRLAEAEAAGRVRVALQAVPLEITPEAVRVEQAGREFLLAADHVVVCAGGILPRAFLETIGVKVETKHGKA